MSTKRSSKFFLFFAGATFIINTIWSSSNAKRVDCCEKYWKTLIWPRKQEELFVISKRQFLNFHRTTATIRMKTQINQNKLLTVSQHCLILATSLTNGFLKFLTRFSGKWKCFSRVCDLNFFIFHAMLSFSFFQHAIAQYSNESQT